MEFCEGCRDRFSFDEPGAGRYYRFRVEPEVNVSRLILDEEVLVIRGHHLGGEVVDEVDLEVELEIDLKDLVKLLKLKAEQMIISNDAAYFIPNCFN